MKSQSVLTSKGVAFRAAAVLVFSLSLSAKADVIGTKPWTTIGATGTVTDGQVITTGNIAYLDATRAVLLYNIVAVDGLQETNGVQPVHPIMTVRFRDNGANNRVVVVLKRLDLGNGAVQNMLTMDSDDHAGSASFQSALASSCGNSFSFDFSQYAYYAEATLTRTGLPVTAGLSSIQVGMSASPCITAGR